MKLILTLLSLLFINWGYSQLVANGAYLMGNKAEIAINNGGFEGAPDIAGSHSRSDQFDASVYFGFVANPQDDGWVQYNGDFFTPGSPENGFGLEIGGTNYSNNAANGGFDQISGALSNYTVNGNCLSVDWIGTAVGVQLKLTYRFNTDNLFYVIDVEVTNNTAATLSDVYFYRNIDPDNNVSLSGSYTTTNTIVNQATASCPISLVSATQTTPHPSYVGIASVGQNFRVTTGGFSNRDGSDIWNAAWPFTGTLGSVSTADEAISIAYKIASLPAGSTETFSYAIVLDDNQVQDAFSDLYSLSYEGASGPVDECSGASETNIVELDCNVTEFNVSITGPNISGYTWEWTPTEGLNTTTGPDVVITPTGGSMIYTVVGTPLTCINAEITKQIEIVYTGESPDIHDTTLISDNCLQYDLTNYIPEDDNALPNTTYSFHSAPPADATDMSNELTDPIVEPGDPVYVMMENVETGCIDIYELPIIYNDDYAGTDSTNTFCIADVANLDLNTFIGDVTPGTWQETSSPLSGNFNTATGIFNAGNTVEGIYSFLYVTDTELPCLSDTAAVNITLVAPPEAGADSTISLCVESGDVADLNDLLNGNSTAGTWDNIAGIPQFNVATGEFTNTGVAVGDYQFEYVIAGTDPCAEDRAVFIVSVISTPNFDPIDDLVVCNQYVLPQITGTNLSVDAAYYDGPSGTGNEYHPGDVLTQDGTYYAYSEIEGSSQCVGEEEFNLIVITSVDLSFSADILQTCPNTDITFTNTSGEPTQNCVWDFGDGTISESCGPVVTSYAEPGMYTVTLYAENMIGCLDSVSYTGYIEIVEYPVASFSFSPNDLDIYHTDVEFDNSSIDAVAQWWSFGDGTYSSELEPSHSYPDSAAGYIVQLIVANDIGCLDTTYRIVPVDDIVTFFIPNTFTPDGDEFNNEYRPIIASGIDVTSYHFTVYNRWGEVIFETKDQHIGWDATFNGKFVMDGTYTWILEFKEIMSDKHHEYNGYVNVLR